MYILLNKMCSDFNSNCKLINLTCRYIAILMYIISYFLHSHFFYIAINLYLSRHVNMYVATGTESTTYTINISI